MTNKGLSTLDIERLRHDLKELRDRNLQQATFTEKADLVAGPGIRVIPTEELKSRKIQSRLNLMKVDEEGSQSSLAKDLWWSRGINR